VAVIPVSYLVEDFDLYPRTDVDHVNIASLTEAIRAGVTLPPIIAEEGTHRIVDGWHRRRAYLRALGPDATIEVDLRDYASDDELLLAAIQLNAGHGLRLKVIDQRRMAGMCSRRGISIERIALALHVTPEKVEELRVEVINIAPPPAAPPLEIKQVALPDPLPMKRSVQHLQGQTVSWSQGEAIQRAPGTPYGLLVRQLRDAVGQALINREDHGLMAILHELHRELGIYLTTCPPMAA
jgi:ParB-like chromosome segregation protein Spo0J